MPHNYTQAEYDAFGWNPVRGLPLAESYGLDYESAREATPRYYGVSFGDGNNGVSHTFPNYVVRTCEPFRLAEIAAISDYNVEWREEVKQAIEIDGEADYTIAATVLCEPGSESTYTNLHACGHCDHEWQEDEANSEDAACDCPECGESCSPYTSEENDNSPDYAYSICEVFPLDVEDIERLSCRVYQSLDNAFSEDELKLSD